MVTHLHTLTICGIVFEVEENHHVILRERGRAVLAKGLSVCFAKSLEKLAKRQWQNEPFQGAYLAILNDEGEFIDVRGPISTIIQ